MTDGNTVTVESQAEFFRNGRIFNRIDGMGIRRVFINNIPVAFVNELVSIRREICVGIMNPSMTIRTENVIDFAVINIQGIGCSGNILFIALVTVKVINGSFHKITRNSICG